MSFGTSVCANAVGDRAFAGVSRAVDHFCAPDGKPINMVFLRNGTTFMNTVVEMFGDVVGRESSFELVMPKLLDAPADCGGLLAIPFLDDEPGLGVEQGGQATIYGMNGSNASPGNVAKAAILSTIFNLRIGSNVLDEQGYPRTEIVLSGGLTKTPELAQIVADVFRTPVSLLASAEEGTAWGAALMAKFRVEVSNQSRNTNDWSEFLSLHSNAEKTTFKPNEKSAAVYDVAYDKYKRLLEKYVG